MVIVHRAGRHAQTGLTTSGYAYMPSDSPDAPASE